MKFDFWIGNVVCYYLETILLVCLWPMLNVGDLPPWLRQFRLDVIVPAKRWLNF